MFKRHSRVNWPGVRVIRQRRVIKMGRNDLCPCDSGKKYKDCHEPEGSAYLARLAREADAESLRDLRRRLKEQGVPWYKRLFLRP